MLRICGGFGRMMTMETRQLQRAIKVRMLCDSCPHGPPKGQMLPNGVALPTHPPKYPHTCDKCGATDNYGKCYPSLEYEDVE